MSVSFYVDGEHVMNVANGNFHRICELLGVEMDGGGEMDGAQLEAFGKNVDFVLASLKAMPALDGGKPDVEEVGANGCRIIDCGLPEGYFEERLTQLRSAVEAAQSQHVPLCWG